MSKRALAAAEEHQLKAALVVELGHDQS